jgi:hypothetical protein
MATKAATRGAKRKASAAPEGNRQGPNKVEKLLDRHNACAEARDWVKKNNVTTFEQGWAQCPDPTWLLWCLEHAGYEEVSGRRARKWLHQCLLLVNDHLPDPRSRRALRVLKRYAAASEGPGEREGALASAKRALDARARADAYAKRTSPHFHAARAVVEALAWEDGQWEKRAGEAAVHAATAAAHRPDGLDHAALAAHRRKQADLLRAAFAAEVGELIANLESLA